MDLIQLQDECLANLVDPEIVPLTPSSVVPQIFLPGFAVDSLDLLKLLHKLKVNCAYFISGSELGLAQFMPL